MLDFNNMPDNNTFGATVSMFEPSLVYTCQYIKKLRDKASTKVAADMKIKPRFPNDRLTKKNGVP